jgi:hypothetical protein
LICERSNIAEEINERSNFAEEINERSNNAEELNERSNIAEELFERSDNIPRAACPCDWTLVWGTLVFKKNANFFAENLLKIVENSAQNIDP